MWHLGSNPKLLSQVKTNMRHMEILRKGKLRLNLRKVTEKDFFYLMDEAKKLCFSIFLKENDFLWNLQNECQPWKNPWIPENTWKQHNFKRKAWIIKYSAKLLAFNNNITKCLRIKRAGCKERYHLTRWIMTNKELPHWPPKSSTFIKS